MGVFILKLVILFNEEYECMINDKDYINIYVDNIGTKIEIK